MEETVSYASLKHRILAFLLDYLVIAVYGLLIVVPLSLVFRDFFRPLFSGTPAIAELTGFLLITLPVSLYFLIGECTSRQGTWGKRKLALRVVDREGRRIRLWRSIVRTGVKFLPWETAHFAIWRILLPGGIPEYFAMLILIIVDITVIIYLISPLLNRERRSVYDWLAGTKVIDDRS
jgi:Predicted membrane protein/domain